MRAVRCFGSRGAVRCGAVFRDLAVSAPRAVRAVCAVRCFVTPVSVEIVMILVKTMFDCAVQGQDKDRKLHRGLHSKIR